MDQPVTRAEFNELKEEVRKLREQQTEKMKPINVNVASADVVIRLDKLDQKLDRIDKKQDEHAKGLFMHSNSINALQARFDRVEATMATKDDLAALKTAQDARFDQLEAARDEHNRKLDEQHDMLRQILRILGQQPSS
jgi:flagellar capping protein FliD